MRFLSEIPPQKKMLYAHFLYVLLHRLAIIFFTPGKYFSGDRVTAVQPLHNTSPVFFWTYLLFPFLTAISSLKSQHNVLSFFPLHEQEKCRKTSYGRNVVEGSADFLLQIGFLRPGIKHPRLLLCQHSLMSLCLVTTIQRTSHLEKTGFGYCKSRGVKKIPFKISKVVVRYLADMCQG